MDSLKNTFTEIFKDDDVGLVNEVDVNSNAVGININSDKKENKLKNLLDKHEDEDESVNYENKKLPDKSSLLFKVNDFPELDEVSNMIENEDILERSHNLYPESNVSVISKTPSANKKINKKKKFVSLNVDITKSVTENSQDVQQNFSNKSGNTKSNSKSSSLKKN